MKAHPVTFKIKIKNFGPSKIKMKILYFVCFILKIRIQVELVIDEEGN